MRVIDQLIQHFSDHGALSVDDLDYLYQRGFFSDDAEYDRQRRAAEARAQQSAMQSETLDAEAEVLIERPARKNRRGAKPAKPAYTLSQLEDALASHFAARTSLPGLALLGERLGVKDDWSNSLRALSVCGEADLDAALAGLLDQRPESLAELWFWLDDMSLARLVGDDEHGSIARDFRALMGNRATRSAKLDLLRTDEVADLVRLMEARPRLIAACQRLKAHGTRWARCLAVRGEPHWHAWQGYCWSLVIEFNAGLATRAPQENKPAGYALPQHFAATLATEAFLGGWLLAMRAAPAQVRGLVNVVYGTDEARAVAPAFELSSRTTGEAAAALGETFPRPHFLFEFLCPFAWKIPCLMEGDNAP